MNNLAEVVNSDPRACDFLKVVFLPDYKVSLAEVIIPAADLSEQISTAGMEASGTSNMKFAMNGALTVGTLDGANIEMLEEVGAGNIFIFGLHAAEVQQLRSEGYSPWDWYHDDSRIRRILDSLAADEFSAKEPGIFEPIRTSLARGGRPLPSSRRLWFLCRSAGQGFRDFHRSGRVEFEGDPERGPHEQVFQRPNHPGICTGYLERRARSSNGGN